MFEWCGIDYVEGPGGLLLPVGVPGSGDHGGDHGGDFVSALGLCMSGGMSLSELAVAMGVEISSVEFSSVGSRTRSREIGSETVMERVEPEVDWDGWDRELSAVEARTR